MLQQSSLYVYLGVAICSSVGSRIYPFNRLNADCRDVIVNPRHSIRKLSIALKLKTTNVHKIAKKDSEHHPYKIQITQKINLVSMYRS